jgi:hypothetical protein
MRKEIEEKVTIKKTIYYSDISNEVIPGYSRHFNQCVKCGKHVTDNEVADTRDDGTLCKPCFDEGFSFDYEDGCPSIIDREGNQVSAPWI